MSSAIDLEALAARIEKFEVIYTAHMDDLKDLMRQVQSINAQLAAQRKLMAAMMELASRDKGRTESFLSQVETGGDSEKWQISIFGFGLMPDNGVQIHWTDSRSGTNGADLYSPNVSANGSITGDWTFACWMEETYLASTDMAGIAVTSNVINRGFSCSN